MIWKSDSVKINNDIIRNSKDNAEGIKEGALLKNTTKDKRIVYRVL